MCTYLRAYIVSTKNNSIELRKFEASSSSNLTVSKLQLNSFNV